MKKVITRSLALALIVVMGITQFTISYADSESADLNKMNRGKVEAETGLTDIQGNWAKDDIELLEKNKIVSGYDNGTFKPEKSITREEAAIIIARHAGIDLNKKADVRFSDAKGRFSSAAIAALVDLNIINGYPDGEFKPEKEISREEFCVILYRYLKQYGKKEEIERALEKQKAQGGNLKFNDGVADWAKESVGVLSTLGIVNGLPNGNFAGTSMINRASVAKLIVKTDGYSNKSKLTKTLNGTEIPEKQKTEEKVNIGKISGNSGKSSGGKSNKVVKGELMHAYSDKDLNGISLFAFIKSSDESIESVKNKVYKGLDTNAKSALYFAQPFADTNVVLVVDAAKNLKSKYKYDLPKAVEGIWASNDENEFTLLNASSTTPAAAAKILLFGGKQSNNKLYTAEYMVGLPGNELHLGVAALEDTKLIAGMNFNAKGTVLPQTSNGGAISVSRKEIKDLAVIGNTFTFNNEKSDMSRAVVGYDFNGKIRIKNNLFVGKNLDTRTDNTQSYGMIHGMSRSAKGVELYIEDNKFDNIGSTAINITLGDESSKREKIRILNNRINSVNDNGMKISLFPMEYPDKHDLVIKGNTVRNYGLGKYENYTDGGAGALGPSNDNEAGIELNYAGLVCGTYVNEHWVSKDSELAELMLRENDVMAKRENDKNEGVVDSIDVLVGQKARFLDTKKVLNSNSASVRNGTHSFVVTKNENGDLTLGQNPENPIVPVKVKDLHIVGTGTGVVNLASTLHISGKLVVELPKGTLNNKANVKAENVEIKAEAQIKNDAKFAVSPQSFTRKEAPQEGLKISVTEVKNDKGEAVGSGKTTFSHLKLYVEGKLLNENDFEIDEVSDTITIKKSIADTWEKSVNIVVEIADVKNKVSKLSSQPLPIEIVDQSTATIAFSKKRFTHRNPYDDVIAVTVSNLKNKHGQVITKEDSILKAKFMRWGKPVADSFLRVDDAEDKIYLSKELLAGIPATEYRNDKNQNIGTPTTYEIVIYDDTNGIGEVSEEVRFEVVDNSSAIFEFEQGLTFTEGDAPAEGIKLFVKDIRNSSGTRVYSNKSKLTDNINIEPFPVERSASQDSEVIAIYDGEGKYVKEIFNPEYIVIDDANDSITFTKAYLDRMKTAKDSSTESGMKTFTFIYEDEAAKVSVRSPKVALHIKKKEAVRSNNVKVTFKENTFAIQENTLVSAGKKIDVTQMACNILEEVVRENPRQRVHIIKSDGSIRKSYEAIKEGDSLKIVAEDSKTSVTYRLVFGEYEVSELFTISDSNIVLSKDTAAMRIKKGVKVSDLKNAINGAAGTEISIVGRSYNGEYTVVDDATVSAEHRLKAVLGEKVQYFTLRPIGAEKKVRSLAIGNSDYGNPKVNLNGPANDLKLMEAIFNGNRIFGKKPESAILKYNVNRQQFIDAIHLAFQDATDDDISYLYYSGHGFNQNGISYICAVGAPILPNGQNDVSGWISVNDLKKELDKVAGTKVIILDCCNAGGFIGKKAVDAVTSPTPQRGSRGANADDTSQYFTVLSENIKEVFLNGKDEDAKAVSGKTEYNADVNYLTDEEYKILVASSENEYSYEDKKEAIGKFTKQLALAAGYEDGDMKGDSDRDRALSMKEAYDYLMRNVSSISHIQCFPFNDSFSLFENVTIIKLSADTRVTSNKYSCNILKNGKGKYYGTITAKSGNIDGSIRVEDFLADFIKNHDAQKLLVVQNMGTQFVELTNDEALGERNLFLQVEAENGEISRYSFTSKMPPTPENDTSVSLMSGAEQRGITMLTSPAVAIKVTKNMTVGEFLNFIEKGQAEQTLKVLSKERQEKEESEQLANLDKLEVTAKDGQTKGLINITVISTLPIPGGNGDGTAPDFGGAFTVTDGKIKSGTVRLNGINAVTVDTLLSKIINKQRLGGVPMIYPSTGNINNPMASKRRNEVIKNGDRLVVKPMNEGFPFPGQPQPQVRIWIIEFDE